MRRIAIRPRLTAATLGAAVRLLLALGAPGCDAPAGAAGGGEAAEAARWAGEQGLLRVTPAEMAQILRMSPLGAPPRNPTNRVADDPCAAWLGQRLFFDARLSANGGVACATCHPPAGAFTQHRPLGEGLGRTRRNVPALFNLAWQRWYLWDGGRDSLWAQATGPLEHPDEQGTTRVAVVRTVLADREARRAYEALFGPAPDLSDETRFPPAARPDPLRPYEAHHRAWAAMEEADRERVTRAFVNLAKAIEAYERRLVSADAPLDRFVRAISRRDTREARELPESARRGLELFVGRAGCARCHHGPLLSDLEFHDIRLPARFDLPDDRGRLHGIRRLLTDPFNAAGRYSDDRSGSARSKIEFLARGPETDGAFRTPSLRNVALTAPYFHQGTHETLRDVLTYYSLLRGARPAGPHDETLIAPLRLGEREIDRLLDFLETLTGAPVPERLARPPEGPAPPACRTSADRSY